MKQLRVLCFVAVFTFSIAMVAASPAPAGAAQPAPQAQQSTQPAPSMADVVDRQVSMYERNVVGVAEAMPPEKYDFTPESLKIPGSEYKGVRTFAQLITHTAEANFHIWGAITGEKAPDTKPEDLKTKDQIVQYLKDSFAMGHRAAKSLTAENALQEIPFFRGKSPRLFVATFAVIHAADEYGQMVEYLRMNGIVPPASRRSM